MGQKREFDVNKQLVSYYVTVLCRSIENFVFERDRIETDYKEKYAKLYKKYKLDKGGFSRSTITRMLGNKAAESKVTRNVFYDVLLTLELLTKEAYKSDPEKFNPGTLPVLLNLHVIPDVLVPILGPNRNTQTQQMIESASKSHLERLTPLECYQELTESIINSQTTEVLYASICLGWTLRFLMACLGQENSSIGKIVVRGIYLDDAERTNARKLILRDMELVHMPFGKIHMEYHDWNEDPGFYGFMYGKETIYFGHLDKHVSITNKPSYSRPILTPMYRMTKNNSKQFEKYKALMICGILPYPLCSEK